MALLQHKIRNQKKSAKSFKDISEFLLYSRMYFKTHYQQMTSHQQFMDMKPLETKIEKIKEIKGVINNMISSLEAMGHADRFTTQQARCP